MLVAVALLLLASVPAGAAPPLEAGVGRADITPPTGYYLGGYSRADRTGQGVHSRLYATAMVLERGDRKVALVALDLFMSAGGMVRAAAARAGFSERNVLVSASHTHSGPGGFANFDSYNFASPSAETIDDPSSFVALFRQQPTDRRLYTFLVRRIAEAIELAERDLGPAAAAWGSTRLVGLTRNRSIEAHLANHGVVRQPGQGHVHQDPLGYEHTIDPAVNVLRVDKLADGRRIPIGAWSTFANHGTVASSRFEYYNADHHGAATRVFERQVRRAGNVPPGQLVANLYGNSNEGDQSAGLDLHGPAYAERVGRVEARAMLDAWRHAGRRLTRRPDLALRWTRLCFCGQRTRGGRIASSPTLGVGFLTGSEEERGPLFDVTGVSFEGRRNPVAVPPQGHKLGFPGQPAIAPEAVPLVALRVGDRMIVSFPGEATAEVGRRTRRSVKAATASSGVERVVVSGLANEYLNYFTTPQEYDRQHYEGASTIFGELSSVFLQEKLTELARRLVSGRPAQRAYPFDARNGVVANAKPFSSGAPSGQIVANPRSTYPRLEHARVSWKGGRRGFDRPLDRAFVTVQRKDGERWRTAARDLGLEILWRVEGRRYGASWEIPRMQPSGTYRFEITARRYELRSKPFRVGASRALTVEQVPARAGRVAVELGYPEAVPLRDFTWRPRRIDGGRVRFEVGDRRVVEVTRAEGSTFSVRAADGQTVRIPAGAARDDFGNRNGGPVVLTSP